MIRLYASGYDEIVGYVMTTIKHTKLDGLPVLSNLLTSTVHTLTDMNCEPRAVLNECSDVHFELLMTF